MNHFFPHTPQETLKKKYVNHILAAFASRFVLLLFCFLFLLFKSYTVYAQPDLSNEGPLATIIRYNGTYQDFLIPNNPNLKINFRVKAGDGGNARVTADDVLFRGDYRQPGGRGQNIDFSLSVGPEFPIGTTLRFIIGNQGVSSDHGVTLGVGHSAGGGGGGTAILVKKPGESEFELLVCAGGGGGAYQGMLGGFSIDSEAGGDGGTENRTGTGDLGSGRVIPGLGGEGTDFGGGGGGHFIAGSGAGTPCLSHPRSGGGEKGSILGSRGGETILCGTAGSSQNGGYGYGGGGAGRGAGGGGGGFIGGGAGGFTGAGAGAGGYLSGSVVHNGSSFRYDFSFFGPGPEGVVLYSFHTNVPPIARCRPATIPLVGASAVINWERIDDGSIDEDGHIVSRVVSPSTVTQVGYIRAVMTITDENGAASSCTSAVQVIEDPNLLRFQLNQVFSSNTSLSINKKFYSDGDTIKASIAYCPLCPKFNDFVIFVSPSTGDAEGLRLKPYNATKSITDGILKISDKGTVGQRDGILTVEPGETIIAYYYNYNLSDKNHKSGTQPDMITDFAFARGKESFEKSLMINKGYALSPDEKEDKSATILEEGTGLPTQISSDIVIFYSKGDDDLKSFLSYSHGTLINMIPGSNAKESNTYSIQIPVKDENLNDLAQLRKFQGNEQRFLASNEDGMKLVQFCTIANLMGYKVSVNNKIQAFSDNSRILKRITNSASFLTNPAGLNERIPGSFTQSFTDIRKVWNFMAIWDKDRTPVRVGIIDFGFHQNRDYRTSIDGIRFPISQCAASFNSVECGPSAAEGIPTVGAGLFGDRLWHGNAVEARAIGVLNNNFGTAGTGGQVGLPVIIKQNGADAYAFNMGGAVRAAVANGSQVINISGGYPCRALTSLGDLSYCDAGSRSDICAALFPVVSAASILACSVAAGFIPLPGVFEGCITGTLTAYVGACTAQLAIGNTAEILNSAIQFAKSRGVAVVTSAGNFIRPENLPELLRPFVILDQNRMTVDDWQMIPASLPDVITVGAANPSAPFANNQVFGNRVDVWAPEDGIYIAPVNPLLPASVSNPDDLLGGFNGTSAAAPFITGLIADAIAINPTLNTPAGVERIRGLLTSTAWQAADLPADPTGRRRNLINPIAFLKAVGGDIPFDILNNPVYGDNWNIDTSENRDDHDNTGTLLPFNGSGSITRSGSIIFIPGTDGASNIVDLDKFEVNINPDFRSSSTKYLRLSLRTPTGSRYGNLNIRGHGIRLLSTEAIGANEEIKIFHVQDTLVANTSYYFAIEGQFATEDNIYSLSISAVSCSPDYPALRSLYQTTGGPSWTRTWDLSDCTCRGWYGVNLDRDQRVRYLTLPDNNLVGVISANIDRLSRLEWLNLSNNELSYEIPSFPPRLNILNLSHNFFNGPIPRHLVDLPNLRILRLDHNQFSGCFPGVLGVLCTRLTSYDFTVNQGLPGGGDFAAFCANGAGNCDCAMRPYYRDADMDLYGNPEIFIRACNDAVPAGYVSNGDDCNDANSAAHPGVADNTCNNIDNDCDGQIDEDVPLATYYRDVDGDNYGNSSIVITISSCVPPVGYVIRGNDCNDNNNTINPGTLDNTCNGIDENCDNKIDNGYIAVNCMTCLNGAIVNSMITYYQDADGDGYGDPAVTKQACDPPAGYVANNTDCDDTKSAIHPGATDNTCNGIDDNCNGKIDEGYIAGACAVCKDGKETVTLTLWYQDADGDTYGNPLLSKEACVAPAGFVSNNSDCDDTKASVHPGTLDNNCNGIDDDCDGKIDEDYVAANCTTCVNGVENTTLNNWYLDADIDGYAASSKTACLSPGPGYSITVLPLGDCNDNKASINPGALDNNCNGVDENCNGSIDEGYVAANCMTCVNGVEKTTLSNWYLDADGDGYAVSSKTACLSPGPGYTSTVLPLGDCNDANAAIYPNAPDNTCDGIDNDCDNKIDEEYIVANCKTCANGIETTTLLSWYLDGDGDGYASAVKTACLSPGPGYTTSVLPTGDCNDANATIHPNAPDNTCDGIDNDCDTKIDEGYVAANCKTCANGVETTTLLTWYLDSDGDGYAISTTQSCLSPGIGYTQTLLPLTDCNDKNAAIHPGAIDNKCNGIDENCNGTADEGFVAANCTTCANGKEITTLLTWYLDGDGDGYATSVKTACLSPGSGYTLNVLPLTDCNDNNGLIHPAASDNNCNGIDENCNGTADEGYAAGDCKTCINGVETTTLLTWYLDSDGDGYAVSSTQSCLSPGAGYTKTVTPLNDCNDNPATGGTKINPGVAESCKNGIDDNCDGKIDENCAPLVSDNPKYVIGSGLVSRSSTATIDVFPNPTNGLFTVQLNRFDISKETTVSVYSAIGIKLFETTSIQRKSISINVQNRLMPPGMYVLQVQNNEMKYQQKIMIN